MNQNGLGHATLAGEALTLPGSDLLGDVAEEFFLFEGHLPGPLFGPLMLIPNQVQDAMDYQKDNHFHLIEAETVRLALGRLNGNHQVTEEMGMEGREFPLPHGKGQDIGRFVPTKVSPVQRLDLEIIDKEKAELSLKKPQFRQ
jgi:hypothetical protein